MTIQEMYEWAKANNALNKKVSILHTRTFYTYNNEEPRLDNREDKVVIE